MLISTTNKVQYTIAYPFGGTYPVTFKYWLGAEIHAVLSFPPGTDDLPLVLDTDYSLSAPGDTGTLTKLTDWDHAAVRLTIYRELINDQQTDYRNGEAVDMDLLEQDFDRAAARDQQIAEKIERGVTIPISDDDVSLELPAKAARASTLFGWDADGKPIPGAGGVIAASVYIATLLDDLTPEAAQKTLGLIPSGATAEISTFIKSLLDDADAAAARATLDLVFYDLVVDSNAKLDLWCQAVAGQYKRVYIKAGTWTASALSPTAGVLINLDAAGTVYVLAEKGSSIVYSGSYNGILKGLYHASAPTDMSLERFENVKVTITNAYSLGTGIGFYNCTILIGCTGNGSGTGGTANAGTGFYNCVNLTNCIGTGGIGGDGNGTGFNYCTHLVNCIATGTGGASGFGGRGFANSTHLVNCIATGTGGTGEGFWICTNLTNCAGTGTAVGGAGTGAGFYQCTGVVLCTGQGLADTGSGYGFSGCRKMQQNKPSAASKTSTYYLSYADEGSTNACADTAAGGYNS